MLVLQMLFQFIPTQRPSITTYKASKASDRIILARYIMEALPYSLVRNISLIQPHCKIVVLVVHPVPTTGRTTLHFSSRREELPDGAAGSFAMLYWSEAVVGVSLWTFRRLSKSLVLLAKKRSIEWLLRCFRLGDDDDATDLLRKTC